MFVLIISQACKVGCAAAMGVSSKTEYQYEPPEICAKIVVNWRRNKNAGPILMHSL